MLLETSCVMHWNWSVQIVHQGWRITTSHQIHEIHERQEIPIVVGGTSYWIQHLMFPNRLAGPNAPQSTANTLNSSDWSKEVSDSIAALPPNLLQLFGSLPEEPPSAKTNPDEAFDLHRLLCLLDPPVGNRWHWRDTRKVLRSLNIILESRRRASDIFFDQSKETGSCKPRFVERFELVRCS